MLPWQTDNRIISCAIDSCVASYYSIVILMEDYHGILAGFYSETRSLYLQMTALDYVTFAGGF